MKLSARWQAARGFSLIELMVSMAIALVVTLAVFGVLVASEDRKRTSTALNDANQTGAYAAHLIDRSIRSAGSGQRVSTPPLAETQTSIAGAFQFGRTRHEFAA